MDNDNSEELRNDLEFYKKRFENVQKEKEVLKKESLALRTELNSMKDFVKKIVTPKKGVNIKSPENGIDKNDMLSILEFQRKRIDELERDCDDTKRKYEKLLFEKDKEEDKGKPASVALADKNFSAEAALQKANERIGLLESKLRDVTTGYAKEVTTLKNKLVESQANDILNARRFNEHTDALSKTISLTSLVKREARLDPLRAEKPVFFNQAPLLQLKPNKPEGMAMSKPSEDEGSLFSYGKRGGSRQKL